jgi:hypothetical protein
MAAVIVTAAVATPVAKPDAVMVALFGSDERQVTCEVMSFPF